MTIHDRIRNAPTQYERELYLEEYHWRRGFNIGVLWTSCVVGFCGLITWMVMS